MRRGVLTILDRLGPELIKEGLIENDPWIIGACEDASALFADKDLKIIAVLLAALAPRAVDYLRQAPVLALAILNAGKDRQEEISGERRGPAYVATRKAIAYEYSGVLTGAPSLRDLLARFGLPRPLRRLVASSLHEDHWAAVRQLAEIDPSTLAQLIPDNGFTQGQWLTSLREWMAQLDRRCGDPTRYFLWAAREFGRDMPHSRNGLESAWTIADFAAADPAHRRFNPDWDIKRVSAEVRAWHERIARMKRDELLFEKYGLKWDEPMDYGDLPTARQIGDFNVIALRSGADLTDEGAQMHHCVGSYVEDVARGKSRIFSIRSVDGKRHATLELVRDKKRGWRNAQIKGRFNSVPETAVGDCAKQFIALVNEMAAQ
jgi:hypothetical protein